MSCRSPRLIRHGELDSLSIAHVDCDAFYAAVEKRDNPDIRDLPVIVGGGRRGVVATACYIARVQGVHSAMPMFKALKACPDAVVIRPDMKKYAALGREIRQMMRSLTPLVEPVSIDEAFLDLSGTQRLHGRTPAQSLAWLSRRIERDVGVSVSLGLSYNKFLAKIASDMDKPRGFSVIGRKEAPEFLKNSPVSLIWGVGKVTQKTLIRDGIRSIGQLVSLSRHELNKRYGAIGERLYHLARGQDTRPVSPASETKSISAETTFSTDISDPGDLEKRLWALCDKVAGRCKGRGLAGETATLKLKTAGFRTLTRSRRLDAPTRLADRLFQTLRPVLAREADGTAFRLIGAGLSRLHPVEVADPAALFDPAASARAEAELAMDDVRARFGSEAVSRGLGFTPQPPAGKVRRT